LGFIGWLAGQRPTPQLLLQLADKVKRWPWQGLLEQGSDTAALQSFQSLVDQDASPDALGASNDDDMKRASRPGRFEFGFDACQLAVASRQGSGRRAARRGGRSGTRE
jgi:hypothetical protein